MNCVCVAFPVQRRSIFVQTEQTPNPDSLKFIPGVQVLEKGTVDFGNAMAAVSSPLAKRIFLNDGVRSVFLAQDFITVTKDEYADWDDLKPAVFSDLMEFFSSGEQALSDAPPPSVRLLLHFVSFCVELALDDYTISTMRLRLPIFDDHNVSALDDQMPAQFSIFVIATMIV